MKKFISSVGTRCAVALILLVLAAPVAFAADATPPVITHEPVTAGLEGHAITIRADVTDDNEVSAVYLYFRPVATSTFLFVTMAKGSESYVGQIPSRYVETGTLEYYLMAVDSEANVATLKDSSGEPFSIGVLSVADVEPQATLVYPRGVVTQPTGVVVSIKLNEVFALADKGVFTVTFDGKDVTDACTITKSSITYAVPGSLSSGKYDIRLSVADVNGKPYSALFTVTADVEDLTVVGARPIAGDVMARYTYDSGTGSGSAYARVNVSGELGPLSARASVRTDDPMLTGVAGQPKSHIHIGYRSRLLDLDLIDSSPHLSDLTVNSYPIRGVAGTLKLGPFSTMGAYGASRQPVPGETYERRLVAMRSATDLFGVLKTGFNLAQVSDQVVDAEGTSLLIDGVSASQSYTASIDGQISLFGASIILEAATNVLFNGVQDRMDWEQLLIEAGVSDASQYAGILAALLPIPDYYMLKQVIDALDEGDPVPPEFNLANIVFPVFDTACRAAIEIPLAGSKLKADYFWIGQKFRPLAAPVKAGYRGYEVSISDVPIGGIARVSLSAGSKVDMVESPFINPATASELIDDLGLGSDPVADSIEDLLLSGIGSDAGGDQTVYNTMGLSVFASPQGMPPFTFGYDVTTKSEFATGHPKSEKASYAVDVSRIGYMVGETRATLGLGLRFSQETDVLHHQDSERGASISMKTTLPLKAVKTSLKAEVGQTVSLKDESNPNDDVTLDTNGLEVRLSRAFGKLLLSTTAKYVSKDNRLLSGSDAVGSTSLSLVVAGQYSMGRSGSLGVQIRAVDYRNRVDNSKDKQVSTLSVSYRLAF